MDFSVQWNKFLDWFLWRPVAREREGSSAQISMGENGPIKNDTVVPAVSVKINSTGSKGPFPLPPSVRAPPVVGTVKKVGNGAFGSIGSKFGPVAGLRRDVGIPQRPGQPTTVKTSAPKFAVPQPKPLVPIVRVAENVPRQKMVVVGKQKYYNGAGQEIEGQREGETDQQWVNRYANAQRERMGD